MLYKDPWNNQTLEKNLHFPVTVIERPVPPTPDNPEVSPVNAGVASSAQTCDNNDILLLISLALFALACLVFASLKNLRYHDNR